MTALSKYKVAALCSLLCVVLVCHGALPGHMQPLGSHMEPEPVRRLDYMPSPQEFFEDFVRPKVPVVFEGLLLQQEVFRNWQSDDYLRYVCGRRVVTLSPA